VVDGATTAYVYDEWNPYSSVANDILLEYSDGVLTRRWLHGAKVDEPLAFEAYTGTTAAGTGAINEVFADRQGSILAVVDPVTGTKAAEYTYDSFGQITQVTGTLSQPFAYTAREYDAETGLYYYRARYYDPALGQFVQADPIGFAAGDLNIYTYVENDPYSWSDPSGLQTGVCTSGVQTGTSNTGPVCGAAAVGAISPGLMNLARFITNQLLTAAYRDILHMEGSDDDAGAGAGAETGAGANGGGCDPEDPECEVDDCPLPDERTGSANKTDMDHAFADVIDNYAGSGTETQIPTRGPGGTVTGTSTLYQVEGSLNGTGGVFEWIVDGGKVTHRLFKRGYSADGKANYHSGSKGGKC